MVVVIVVFFMGYVLEDVIWDLRVIIVIFIDGVMIFKFWVVFFKICFVKKVIVVVIMRIWFSIIY